jgi:glycosyltransferase involved in cell wall biosynthesis
MKKKKIIHFIFNLGRGGAETMTVRVIKELQEYQHIVVTLFPLNHFKEELQCDKLVCLNISSLLQLPLAMLRFKKLVKEEAPDIVHTHLFWPTFVARFTVPKRIPLITTIHAFIVASVEYKRWYIALLDKISYRFRKSVIIAVAKGALDEYLEFHKIAPQKAYVLYTFVDLNRFNIKNSGVVQEPATIFKIITVGALREQKNHLYLVEAMTLIKEENIELDIYGVGDKQQELLQKIEQTGARINLKGEVSNIQEIIPLYDLYTMSSTYEGFSLSVLEAMAMGIPLLLSDMSSFREQCEDTAKYFSLEDKSDFIKKLLVLRGSTKEQLEAMGELGRQRAINNFTLPQHVEGLRRIYTAAIAGTH